MVGRELSAVFPKASRAARRRRARARAASAAAASGVRDVNLTVRAGEILGLAGLVGAGRTELARVLFGLTPADAGEILPARQAGRRSTRPRGAVDAGHRLRPRGPPPARRDPGHAGRREHHARRSCGESRRAGCSTSAASGGSPPTSSERLGDQDAVGRRRRSATSPAATSRRSRWPAGWRPSPSVLILDEPTQGVDVGAKAEIHRLMGELAGRGLAILMISSELPEVLGMSDRIAVMHGGTRRRHARPRRGDAGERSWRWRSGTLGAGEAGWPHERSVARTAASSSRGRWPTRVARCSSLAASPPPRFFARRELLARPSRSAAPRCWSRRSA